MSHVKIIVGIWWWMMNEQIPRDIRWVWHPAVTDGTKSRRHAGLRTVTRTDTSASYTPFTRWSWLDELARRALVEAARRALDERTMSARRALVAAASWMFAILHHSNDQIASSSSQLVERSSIEPASSCKRGISQPMLHAAAPYKELCAFPAWGRGKSSQ